MRPSARSLLVFAVSLQAVTGIQFSAYPKSDNYKCGAYKKGRVDDRALSYYYTSIRQFIEWLSLPFPHQELLNDGALLGDWNEWRLSFESKYMQWFAFEQWVLVVCVALLFFSVIFPILYIFYRCISACCASRQSKKVMATDAQFDGCKRHFLNAILIVLVLVDVFAASALLVTGQYAEYGMDELPSRLNQCVDDLSLYKRETDMQIRKLLIDDWRDLNSSIVRSIDQSGELVIERMKKVTGAYAIDAILNVSQEASKMNQSLTKIGEMVDTSSDFSKKFNVEFSRMKNTLTMELKACMKTESTPMKVICRRGQDMLDGMSDVDVTIDRSVLDTFMENQNQGAELMKIEPLLKPSNKQFEQLEKKLQAEIAKRTIEAKNVLKQIGDDLFTIAEKVSSKIRQANFDFMYEAIGTYTDKSGFNGPQYVRYSWFASLIITALFVLLSLAFLLGIFYGLCGRRPTFYNDDCCVRSTGSKFYACGIWLSISMFTVLCIATAALLVIFSNVTHFLCDPLDHPLKRTDMLTLAERYIDLYSREEKGSNEFLELMLKRTPADVIRACDRNETFYQIFELDAAYHLNDLEAREKEAFDKFSETLDSLIKNVPIQERMDSFITPQVYKELEKLSDVNISQVNQDAIEKIKRAIYEMDFKRKMRELEASIPHGETMPKAVQGLKDQVDSFDRIWARPLRIQLMDLQSNLTTLNTKLATMQLPVESLMAKLVHAQALLSTDVQSHVTKAANEVMHQLKEMCGQYISHVRQQMQTEVTSCMPITRMARDSRDAVCMSTVDPINGSWMSMFICLLVTFPIVLITTCLVPLYNKMHTYPKYTAKTFSMVHEPNSDHPMSSFITDTYDTRRKPVHYANYSFTGDYQTPFAR